MQALFYLFYDILFSVEKNTMREDLFMKTVKKATIAIIAISAIVGTAALAFVTAATVWANKPRGVRIRLEDED